VHIDVEVTDSDDDGDEDDDGEAEFLKQIEALRQKEEGAKDATEESFKKLDADDQTSEAVTNSAQNNSKSSSSSSSSTTTTTTTTVVSESDSESIQNSEVRKKKTKIHRLTHNELYPIRQPQVLMQSIDLSPGPGSYRLGKNENYTGNSKHDRDVQESGHWEIGISDGVRWIEHDSLSHTPSHKAAKVNLHANNFKILQLSKPKQVRGTYPNRFIGPGAYEIRNPELDTNGNNFGALISPITGQQGEARSDPVFKNDIPGPNHFIKPNKKYITDPKIKGTPIFVSMEPAVLSYQPTPGPADYAPTTRKVTLNHHLPALKKQQRKERLARKKKLEEIDIDAHMKMLLWEAKEAAERKKKGIAAHAKTKTYDEQMRTIGEIEMKESSIRRAALRKEYAEMTSSSL
jgi:hypothetical protein